MRVRKLSDSFTYARDVFSLYIRAYWPDAAIPDGTWMPPKISKVR